MSELTSKHCEPCEGGTPPLGEREIERLLGQLDGWNVIEGRKLEKEYRFADFRQALAYVNRLGEVAEAEGHHPDICFTWGKVRVELSPTRSAASRRTTSSWPRKRTRSARAAKAGLEFEIPG